MMNPFNPERLEPHEMLASSWLGMDEPFLDRPFVSRCGPVILGRYGGSVSAGAVKNEDGAFVLVAEDGSWHFAVLLDAHHSGESASLVVNTLANAQSEIITILRQPCHLAFPNLQRFLIGCFSSDTFKAQCCSVRGETACLACFQKDKYLSWLSIGDNQVYLFHPELAQLGQYGLNQRNFYEWIGQVNTFDLPVPCHSSGVRELRHGQNQILMVTDGLLECAHRPFNDPRCVYEFFAEGVQRGRPLESVVQDALNWVHEAKGRDSATIISWLIENCNAQCAYPST